MCSSRKYLYPPHGRSLKILRGWGSQKPKFLKESMELNWNFQRGGGKKIKKPSVGGVWIFSGTTHWKPRRICTGLRYNKSITDCNLLYSRRNQSWREGYQAEKVVWETAYAVTTPSRGNHVKTLWLWLTQMYWREVDCWVHLRILMELIQVWF